MASLLSFAKGIERQVNVFDNGATYSRPAPAPVQRPVPQPPQQHASILHDITHNPVTNFAGNNLVKPIAQIPSDVSNQLYNRGVAPVFHLPNLNVQQSGPIASRVAHVTGATGSLHQTVSDLAQGGLMLASGGLSKGLEAGATRILPSTLPKIVPRIVSNATIGAGFNAASAAGQGAKPLDIVKAAGVGAALGGTVPVAGAAVKGAAKLGVDALPKVKDAVSLTPRATLNDQRVLKDYSDYLVGSNKATGPEASNLIAQARLVGDKHGVELRTGSVADRLDKTNSVLDQIGQKNKQISEGGYAKIPGASPGETPPKLPVSKLPTVSGKAGRSAGISSKRPSLAPRLAEGTEPRINQLKSGLPKLPTSKTSGPVSLKNTIPPIDRTKLTGRALSIPNKNFNEGAFSEADITSMNKQLAAENLTHIPQPLPKEPTAKLPQAENTARNPMKVNIPEVNAGDYAKARSNAQLASNPIEYSAGQAAQAAKGMTTSKLARLVEGTDKIATPAERKAVDRYNLLSNRTHATSQALGGNTNFVKNYFRHEWDLSNPEMAQKFEDIINSRGGASIDPYAFGGLDRQPRVFNTVAEGEKAGFNLKNQNAASEVLNYGKGSANALKRQALVKGLTEADMNEAVKERSLDLGNGQTLPLSEKGIHEARVYQKTGQPKAPLKAYRAANRGLKQTLLSASEFHPINISLLKAAPSEALAGHPVLAAKGAYGTFRSQIGRGYSDALQEAALKDGTVEKATRIGTPIKAGSDYSTEGKLNIGKSGLGEKTIFEKAMPAMHIRMVQGAIKDLEKKGISLDSPEARQAGLVINKTMGFVNKEVGNLEPHAQKALSDIALAPQFTRAKWSLLKDALTPKNYTKGGVAGKYAASAIAGNTLAATGIATGLGYLLGQKSDDLKDSLIRNVIHPSVPTPLKDKKGNTVELGLPSTYLSEALGLGANLERGNNGHLGVKINPANIPGNLANYGRARLGVLPSTALKIATNTDYAGKPLYDPNAPLGTKAQQAATTTATGLLPIGLQGLVQNNTVEKHLPTGVQQVLKASSPGSNPLLKSVGSSFGLTPRTDQTVGKGLQTSQYYSALDKANSGLNAQEKAAMQMETGSKKNPVTGAYEVAPTSDDSRAKATALLQNPKVINNLATMNQNLAKQGQAIDPLWKQPTAQITKYLQYQAMPPGGGDKTDWMNKNTSWYTPLAAARDTFFNSLPASDPSKPKASITYPTASPAIAALQSQYDSITDSSAKGNFLDSHPELLSQWNKQADYTNAMRTAQGYSALKKSPQATPVLQSFMNTYNAADKATRQSIRNSNPQQYQNMIAYYDSTDLNTINKQGAVDSLQGEPDQTTKQNKAIQSIAQDIYQNPDGTYSIVPAGWMNGLSNSGFSSNSTKVKIPKLPKIKGYKAPKFKVTKVKAPKAAKILTYKPPKLPKFA